MYVARVILGFWHDYWPNYLSCKSVSHPLKHTIYSQQVQIKNKYQTHYQYVHFKNVLTYNW